MSQPHRTTPRRATGFTLIEMMVVIGLVALLAAMALPSIVTMMSAGSDAQAYNLIAAQLTYARALAIERASFAGVHCQIADAKDSAGNLLRPKQDDVCYTGIVYSDDFAVTSGTVTTVLKKFKCHSAPKPVPGGIGFGKVVQAMTGTTPSPTGGTTTPTVTDAATVDSSTGTISYTGEVATKASFTTFTVVFTASGTAVKSVDGATVLFDETDPSFLPDTSTTELAGTRQLWDKGNANGTAAAGASTTGTGGNGHFAAMALTLFEMRMYSPQTGNVGACKSYLNASAQLLPLNTYTGQLYQRE